MKEKLIYSEFVLSGICNCITNKTSEKEIRSLNHEYYDFMEKYHKDHAVCPKCGSKNYTHTIAGYIYNSKHSENYKDKNSVTCNKCGWHGIIHELVPENKQ